MADTDDAVPASAIVGILTPGVEGRVEGLVNAPQLNGLSALVIEHDATTNRYILLLLTRTCTSQELVHLINSS